LLRLVDEWLFYDCFIEIYHPFAVACFSVEGCHHCYLL